MSELAVWLADRRIGQLVTTRRGGSTFRFEEAIASTDPGSPMLSTALPVRAESFDAEITRSWFTGLLPEDRQLDEVRRRFGLQSSSYFDVLREIGWECAGAVAVLEEGAALPVGQLEPLTDGQLAERLLALPAHPFDDDDALRISLSGFQAKMLLTRHDDAWFLPVGGAISTHILKPQPHTSFPGLIAAEAWGMEVARRVTPTAPSRLLVMDGAPLTLVVERFDRRVVGGRRERTHQEDACQAMGLPPERKYAGGRSASASDPSLRKIATLLERHAADPRAELVRLAEQVTVNVAVGNTDAHAKNYGILHPSPGSISLSPLYDVVPATVVNPSVVEMGLRVDGTLRIDRMTGSKLVAEVVSWGVGRKSAQEAVSSALERTRVAIDEVESTLPEADPRLAGAARRVVDGLLGSL